MRESMTTLLKRNVVPAVACAGLLLGGAGTASASYIWTGDGDGTSANDSANWQGNEVPPPDSTIEFNHPGDWTIDFDIDDSDEEDPQVLDRYLLDTVEFGQDAGTYTFIGQDLSHTAGAFGRGSSTWTQESSNRQVVTNRIDRAQEDIFFTGEGTGHLEFATEWNPSNGHLELFLNSDSYRVIFSADELITGRRDNSGNQMSGIGTVEIQNDGGYRGDHQIAGSATVLLTNDTDAGQFLGGSWTVTSDATLAGSGNVGGGTVTVQEDGVLGVGIHGPATDDLTNSPNASLTMGRLLLTAPDEADGSIVRLDIESLNEFNSLVLTSEDDEAYAAELAGLLELNFADRIVGDYQIIDFDDETLGLSGNFDAITDISGNFSDEELSFDPTTGTLTASPEPASLALMGLGGLLLLRRRSRQAEA